MDRPSTRCDYREESSWDYFHFSLSQVYQLFLQELVGITPHKKKNMTMEKTNMNKDDEDVSFY